MPGVFIAFIVLTVLAVLVSLVVFAAPPAVASPWREMCCVGVGVAGSVGGVGVGVVDDCVASECGCIVTTSSVSRLGRCRMGFTGTSPLARVREMDGAIQTDSITVKDRRVLGCGWGTTRWLWWRTRCSGGFVSRGDQAVSGPSVVLRRPGSSGAQAVPVRSE